MRIVQKLTQPGTRERRISQSSREVYQPRLKQVNQTHTGPRGIKTVHAAPQSIEVSFYRVSVATETEKDAARSWRMLTTMFVFGADFCRIEVRTGVSGPPMMRQEIDGDSCDLDFRLLKPGVGRSDEDQVIAWISQRSTATPGAVHAQRPASTVGADVDVTFDDFQPGPHGTEWPRHFLETVQRLWTVKATNGG